MNYRCNRRISLFKPVWYGLCFFFLMRVFTPDFITNNVILNQVYVLVSELLTIWFSLQFVYSKFKEGHCYLYDVSLIVIVIIYFCDYFIVTFIQDGSLRRVCMVAYPIIGTLFFVHIACERHYKEMIKGISWMFNVFLLINLIDMIFVKKVLISDVTSFMVGGRNQLAIFLVLAFVFRMIDRFELQGNLYLKFKDYIYIFVLLISAVLSKSATCLVTTTLIITFFFWGELKKRKFEYNIRLFTEVYVVTWFALIVFRLQYIFAKLIMNVLHKDLTFSHRTIIWDKAIELISKKWLFGYGMSDSVNVFFVNHDYTGGNNNVWSAMSAHNELLQLLYYGGIALIIILAIVYLVAVCNKGQQNRYFGLCFLGAFGVLINWLSEVPGEYALFFMLAMCFYSKRVFGGEYNKISQQNHSYSSNLQGRKLSS